MAMKNLSILLAAFTTCSMAQADGIADQYMHKLDSVKNIVRQNVSHGYNPYCIQLFAPGTLYRSALRQTMTTGEADSDDSQLALLSGINSQLMQAYAQRPWLMTQTEADILAEEDLARPEVQQPKGGEVKLSPQAAPKPDLAPDVEDVKVIVKKPNFWKLSGDASLQLTQNYFSDNWYQGGDNYYSMLTLLNLKALYDNKQGLQWENLLEMKLGFQTNKADETRNFKTFNDQLRLTSKLGFKAAKNWNYAAQVQTWTQFMPSYNKGQDTYSSRFAAPLDLVVSLGMDWKVSLKRFNASLYIAPIAYSMRYVCYDNVYDANERPDILLTNHHGIDIGDKVKHNYGPNITFKYTWNICQNVKWDARLYVMTDLHRVLGEYENTFTFTINKFLNSKLYIYPRYDDADAKYKNENGRFVMFKEWLSLGLNYSW